MSISRPRSTSLTATLGMILGLGMPTATPGRAAETPPDAPTGASARTMSLRDCVHDALARNFDIQIDRFNPRIASYTLSSTYADYDPSLTVNTQHQFASDVGGLDSQNRPYDGSESDIDTISAGLSGILPTGLSYTLSGNVSDTSGSRPGVNPLDPLGALVPRPFDNTRAQWTVANMRQPLLRNLWIDSTRLNLRTRRNDLASSRHALLQTTQNTVAQVEQAYFDLVATLENQRNQQKALELAQRLYSENRRRVELGNMAPLDEKEAQSQMASSRASLIGAQAAVALAQNALKRLITDRIESEAVPDIEPSDTLDVSPTPLDTQASRDRGLRLRPDLHQLNLALANRKLGIRFQRNQLYPQLDVVGNLGYIGNGPEMSDAIGQVSDRSAPFHAIGAVLTIPLSNRRARENYRVVQAQHEQVEVQVRRLRQEIVVQIQDAIQSAQSSFERVGATLEARQFAEAALSAEERKLANGKSTSFVVLQIQQRLNTARFDELRARADYSKALSNLRLREGSTLMHHQIETDDATDNPSR
jgi:outer membrane protein